MINTIMVVTPPGVEVRQRSMISTLKTFVADVIILHPDCTEQQRALAFERAALGGNCNGIVVSLTDLQRIALKP